MNPDLTALLLCPACRSRLGPDEDGVLPCPACGESFAVIEGIPMLAADPYVASFGRQWNRYDVARHDEDRAVFRVKTGWEPESLRGKLVLDAGCGGGRYARLLGAQGARVVGVDLSAAVAKASALCREYPDVLIAQCDLLDLPLADESFDCAFSIGVMHHSPDPRLAFAQVAAKVKPGGDLAVWLYRKNVFAQEWVNSGLRVVTTRMPSRMLEILCAGVGVLGSVPVLNRTLNKVANFSNHPDWTLRVCDNFDWYAPRYQSHHTVEELSGWFEEEGFADLKVLRPARGGRTYDWTYDHNLIIGSGVNVSGRKR